MLTLFKCTLVALLENNDDNSHSVQVRKSINDSGDSYNEEEEAMAESSSNDDNEVHVAANLKERERDRQRVKQKVEMKMKAMCKELTDLASGKKWLAQ